MMYYFLTASLPLLEIGSPAPFTVPEFDEILRENLSPSDQEKMFSCTVSGRYPASCRVYRSMARFEEYLRCRIAQKRAERSGISFSGPDPEEYFSEVDFGLMHASSCSDPLEREYIIDRIRWAYLDDLALEHDFDFDALTIYRIKLMIVNKYADFRVETGTVNFTAALDQVLRRAGEVAKEL